jgi:hypothetical protein
MCICYACSTHCPCHLCRLCLPKSKKSGVLGRMQRCISAPHLRLIGRSSVSRPGANSLPHLQLPVPALLALRNVSMGAGLCGPAPIELHRTLRCFFLPAGTGFDVLPCFGCLLVQARVRPKIMSRPLCCQLANPHAYPLPATAISNLCFSLALRRRATHK